MPQAKAAVGADVQITPSLQVIPHSHPDVLLLSLACNLWNLSSWELDLNKQPGLGQEGASAPTGIRGGVCWPLLSSAVTLA